MRLGVLALTASLAITGVCAADELKPSVTAPAPQRTELKVAPATALDIQALRKENEALKQRIDAIAKALKTYSGCEHARLEAEAKASQIDDSVTVKPPKSIFCGSNQAENLKTLEDAL